MSTEGKGPGRPVKKSSERRTHLYKTYLNDGEKRRFEALLEASNLSASAYLRRK